MDSGQISRFGFIEETDGGETFRYSGAVDWQRSSTNDSTRATAYVQRYGVQLFHNFTYFLNDPENGDQFEQFERRWTTGGKVTHRHMQRIGGKPIESAFGVDLRNDSVGGPLASLSDAGDRARSRRCAPTKPIRRRSAFSARPRSSGAAWCAPRSACAATSTAGTSSRTTR